MLSCSRSSSRWKRFVVHAGEKLTAFLELESAIRPRENKEDCSDVNELPQLLLDNSAAYHFRVWPSFVSLKDCFRERCHNLEHLCWCSNKPQRREKVAHERESMPAAMPAGERLEAKRQQEAMSPKTGRV